MKNNVSKVIQELKENDLVLLPHYIQGEEIPSRMILSVCKQVCDSSSFFVEEAVVLCRQNNRMLPPLVIELDDSYKGVLWAGDILKTRFRIDVGYDVFRDEIHVGILSAISVLDVTSGYKSHAAALNIIYVNSKFIKS